MAAEFNKSELERMQSEAARRVREMQARATQAAGGRKEPSPPPAQKKQLPRGQEGGRASHAPSCRAEPSNSILNLINLKGLDLDGDTSLIALLILLLSSGKGDELLMLALVYILL